MSRTLISIAFVLSISSVFTQSVTAGADQHRLVPPRIFVMATNVATCEEGGWAPVDDAHGPKYFGNVGFLDATYQANKLPGYPSRMDLATPQQQARVLLRFVHRTLH